MRCRDISCSTSKRSLLKGAVSSRVLVRVRAMLDWRSGSLRVVAVWRREEGSSAAAAAFSASRPDPSELDERDGEGFSAAPPAPPADAGGLLVLLRAVL